MTYVVTKYIKGNPYLYEVKSIREGDRVRQVFVRYLGRADKPGREYSETEPVERRERIRRPAVAAISEAVAPTVAVEAEMPAPVERTGQEMRAIRDRLQGERMGWQVPQSEFISIESEVSGSPITPDFSESMVDTHKSLIQRAIREGEDVPAEVLMDYPDLTSKPAPTMVETTPVTKEPWEMTKAERATYIEQKGKESIQKWNESGGKGFPPSNPERWGVSEVNKAADELGMPWGEGRVAIPQHKYEVMVALKQGKTIPPEVLKDYPELTPIPTPEKIKPEPLQWEETHGNIPDDIKLSLSNIIENTPSKYRNLLKGFRLNPLVRGANASYRGKGMIQFSSVRQAKNVEPPTIYHEIGHAVLEDSINTNRQSINDFAERKGITIDWADLEKRASKYTARPNTVVEAFNIKYEKLGEQFADSIRADIQDTIKPTPEVKVAPIEPEIIETQPEERIARKRQSILSGQPVLEESREFTSGETAGWKATEKLLENYPLPSNDEEIADLINKAHYAPYAPELPEYLKDNEEQHRAYGMGFDYGVTQAISQKSTQLTPTTEAKPIEPTAKAKEITPVTPINPYMNMPIERVRRDAEHGVKLAKEALAVREIVTPEVTPVTPEVTGKIKPFGGEIDDIKAVIEGGKPIAYVGKKYSDIEIPKGIVEKTFKINDTPREGLSEQTGYIYYPKGNESLADELVSLVNSPRNVRFTKDWHTKLGSLLGYSDVDIDVWLKREAELRVPKAEAIPITPEVTVPKGYLVRGETSGAFAPIGGTWATDTIGVAKGYGEQLWFMPEPKNPIYMTYDDMWKKYFPDRDRRDILTKGEFQYLKRQLQAEGYDAWAMPALEVEKGEVVGEYKGAKDYWIFEQPKLLKLEELTSPKAKVVTPEVTKISPQKEVVLQKTVSDLIDKGFTTEVTSFGIDKNLEETIRGKYIGGTKAIVFRSEGDITPFLAEHELLHSVVAEARISIGDNFLTKYAEVAGFTGRDLAKAIETEYTVRTPIVEDLVRNMQIYLKHPNELPTPTKSFFDSFKAQIAIPKAEASMPEVTKEVVTPTAPAGEIATPEEVSEPQVTTKEGSLIAKYTETKMSPETGLDTEYSTEYRLIGAPENAGAEWMGNEYGIIRVYSKGGVEINRDLLEVGMSEDAVVKALPWETSYKKAEKFGLAKTEYEKYERDLVDKEQAKQAKEREEQAGYEKYHQTIRDLGSIKGVRKTNISYFSPVDNTQKTSEGFDVGQGVGIVVHEMGRGKEYAVTHINTGLAMGHNWKNRAEAIALAKSVAAITDWSKYSNEKEIPQEIMSEAASLVRGFTQKNLQPTPIEVTESEIPKTEEIEKPKAEPTPRIQEIQYSRDLDIRNIEALPKGTGAKYLITLKGQGDELIAKQWARVKPTSLKPDEVLVSMTPTTTKKPWQMTKLEYRLAENEPRVEAIKQAITQGKSIVLATHTRAVKIANPEHIRITSTGEVQIPQGRKWIYLTDDQIVNLAKQAGIEPVPFEEKVYHHAEVKQALSEGKEVSDDILKDYPDLKREAKTFPRIKETVSGLKVRNDIPNMSSIESSLEDYEILEGIREIPTVDEGEITPPKFYSVEQEKQTKELAEQIKASGEITPLILVTEGDKDYILEGSHRYDALRLLGIKSFPALVVKNLSATPSESEE